MFLVREFTIDDKKILLDMVSEINNLDGNFEGLNNISKIDNYE